jgi:hypothetical protein
MMILLYALPATHVNPRIAILTPGATLLPCKDFFV